ncbi:MAG: HNH endonuclease signature motif containing protein [Blastocatellia bacterium]|nr:HNH endonuclease signature motif containing protein [Blastocatellia bacterium]
MARPHIPQALRQLVRERSVRRCEYCLIHEEDRPESHQVDHVIPLKHDGQTINENLALACAICNNNKGSDFATIDWQSQEITPLFNPRTQHWRDHFRFSGPHIHGRTVIGEATVRLLRMNDPDRVLFRQILMDAGLYPPAEFR